MEEREEVRKKGERKGGTCKKEAVEGEQWRKEGERG